MDFDAGQITAQHRGMPQHSWHATALLNRVLEACTTSPWRGPQQRTKFRRDVAATMAAARLSERGFDIDVLVRRGLEQQFTMAVISEACVAAANLTRGDFVPTAPAELGRWILADLETDHTEAQVLFDAALAGGADSRIVGKVSHFLQAGAERPAEILCWKLGTTDDWLAMPTALPVHATSRDRWILDRFLQTYLDDWHADSLVLEYRWFRGDCGPPVDPAAMGERRLDEHQLAVSVADRAALSEHKHDATPYIGLEEDVIRLLVGGDVEQAILLLRGALHSNPESKRLQSNLAFCRIPNEPEEVLADLEAMTRTHPDPLLATANATLANIAAGRVSQARRWLKEAEGSVDRRRSREYTLWDLQAQPPAVVGVNDVIQHLSRQLGDAFDG